MDEAALGDRESPQSTLSIRISRRGRGAQGYERVYGEVAWRVKSGANRKADIVFGKCIYNGRTMNGRTINCALSTAAVNFLSPPHLFSGALSSATEFRRMPTKELII